MATKSGRLDKFVEKHGVEGAKMMQDEASRFGDMMKQRQRGRNLVLLPEKNRWVGRWDTISTMALLYTATVTPFETAYLSSTIGPEAWGDPWFLVNRALDIIFFVDMVLQFFVAYQTGNDFGGRTWVIEHKKIIRHYLLTWFFLDAGTVFVPGFFDLYLASPAFSSDAVGDVGIEEQMGMLRVLRVLRLVKLVRLVRASRLFDRWKTKITLSHGSQTVLKCVFMLLFCAHSSACIIALQASLHVTPDETWLGPKRYNLCNREGIPNRGADAIEGRRLPAAESELALPGCQAISLGNWYLASFSWSMLVITGSGGTDYYPSDTSDGETIIVTIIVTVSAFMWTWVLALFCDVATNSNPVLTAFRQQLDGLNLFIAINQLPLEMAQRMRSFMHQQKGVQLRENAKRALPNLSPALQVEVMMFVHAHWIDSIWFLKDLDAPVKVRVAMAMEQKVLGPGEVAPRRYLYVIARGTCMLGGRILSRGMAWGDDVILSNQRLFMVHTARAITFVR